MYLCVYVFICVYMFVYLYVCICVYVYVCVYIKVKVKGRFLELYNTAVILVYCILTPNKFPHSSSEAPRIIQMRENSTSEGGNYYN